MLIKNLNVSEFRATYGKFQRGTENLEHNVHNDIKIIAFMIVTHATYGRESGGEGCRENYFVASLSESQMACDSTFFLTAHA